MPIFSLQWGNQACARNKSKVQDRSPRVVPAHMGGLRHSCDRSFPFRACGCPLNSVPNVRVVLRVDSSRQRLWSRQRPLTEPIVSEMRRATNSNSLAIFFDRSASVSDHTALRKCLKIVGKMLLPEYTATLAL